MDINIQALTPERREKLTDGLGGLQIDVLTGGFSDQSRKSLEIVGLSPVEINAIERSNATPGTYSIAKTEVLDVNPFKKETFNLTAQIMLKKNNPELANRMKRLA